jgi:Rrf2 family protein
MLSLTCQTAIKAVIFIATKSDTNIKVSITEIANNISASTHTVGKLLQVLVKDDIIKSLKGPSGGFYITSKQREKTLIKIVESIDGDQVFKVCGLGLSKCSSTHPCPIHNDFKNVRDLFQSICINKTIQDLCGTVVNGNSYLFG